MKNKHSVSVCLSVKPYFGMPRGAIRSLVLNEMNRLLFI